MKDLKSNDLRYSATKTANGETITAKIRLNDECKNGHQDFSITGEIYEAGKRRIDKYMISCGCIHEEIEKHFPEFKIFIDLHLCDAEGVPMHAVSNGIYHLRNGFNSTEPKDPDFENKYCEYYRISKDQFNELSRSRNKLEFALNLKDLGILSQWKQQADKAIKILEHLTGKTFVNDSERSQYIPPTPDEIKAHAEKIANGYYTPEAEAERKQAAINELFDSWDKDAENQIKKINRKLNLKKQLYLLGGKKYNSATIYYDHKNEIAFNWSSEKISNEEIAEIKQKLDLSAFPEGLTFDIQSFK